MENNLIKNIYIYEPLYYTPKINILSINYISI